MLALLILMLVGGLIVHGRQARRIDRLAADVAALQARIGPGSVAAAPSSRQDQPISPRAPADRSRAALSPAAPRTDPAAAWGETRASAPPDAPYSEPMSPEAPPPAADRPALAARWRAIGFEQIVGGRLPIWVGGAALAVAGFYLVALAIDAGLLAPPVRVALAMLFGLGLIGLSEMAGRWRMIAADPRVAQALAGAGIASLYAAAYLASAIYGLISPVGAVLLMAAVTALAIGLALRRGPPTAIMGLLGGFAAPLLALGGHAVLPLLVYLGLLSAGLFALAIRRGWLWLSLATAAGSFLWMLAPIARDASVAAGAFVLAFAAAAALAVPAAGQGGSPRRQALLRGAPLAVGLVELAGLIPASGFGVEGWALYLSLSAGAIALAWREARLTPLVAVALALSLAALLAAAGSAGAQLPLVGAIGMALLFGAAGHALGRRTGDGGWWAAIGAVALIGPLLLLHLDREALLSPAGWAGVALLLALAPLHLAFRSRAAGRAARPYDPALQIAAGAAAILIAIAALDLLPWRLYPAALAAIALALAEGGRRIADDGVGRQALVAAIGAGLGMAACGFGVIAALSLALNGAHVLLPHLPPPGDAVQALLLPAGLLAAAAWRGGRPRLLALLAGAGLAAGLYVLAKQPFAIRDETAFVARGFLERMILTQSLFVAGWLLAHRAPAIARWLVWAAIARLMWFDLIVLNPAFVAQQVGSWPLANLLALHFGLAALWTALAWDRDSARARLAALAAILLGGMLLLVRQLFHGGVPAIGPVVRAEHYGYSVAALAVALGLLGWGARGGDRAMRIAGLGLLALVSLKVFLIDAAALQGILRALSFLGLGVALIGIGWAYGRFSGRISPPDTPFSG